MSEITAHWNANWTAETLPPALIDILDTQAGKVHSAGGAVRSCLADILNAYDDLRDAAACALAEKGLAADAGPNTSIAPWTDAEVQSLNSFQASAVTHPFTCESDDEPCNSVLVATPTGWECPDCDYVQNWATSWMADWGWLAAVPERERLVHKNPELAAQVREGIAQAERGETVDCGSFAQYLDDEGATVHMRRWQYSPPWGCTRWWLPSVRPYRHGDEHCNNTLLVQVPLLGHVILWKPWGRLRTSQCEECAADE